MARLNAKRRREMRALVALHAARTQFELVAVQGDIKSSQASFESKGRKNSPVLYKASASRPTIKTGRKKSGEVSRVPRDEVVVVPNLDTIPHRDQLVLPTPKAVKRQGNRVVLKSRKPFSLDGQ